MIARASRVYCPHFPRESAMPVSIRTEMDELIERATGRLPGESLPDWLAGVALEAVDVAATALAAIDDNDKAADLAQLKIDLRNRLTELLDKVKLPWGLPMAIAGALPMIIGPLVDKLAEYSGDVEAFKQQWVVPAFNALRDFGQRGLDKLGVVDAVD
jgi:hypothetical protein